MGLFSFDPCGIVFTCTVCDVCVEQLYHVSCVYQKHIKATKINNK